MSRRLQFPLVLVAVLVVLCAGANAALADTSAQSAAKALQTTSVYVAPGVTALSPSQAAALGRLIAKEREPVKVAVLPASAGTPAEALSALSAGQHGVFAVVVGKGVAALGDVLPPNQIQAALTAAESSATKPDAVLTAFVADLKNGVHQQIARAQKHRVQDPKVVAAPVAKPTSGSGSAFPVAPVGIGIAVLLIIGLVVRSRRRSR